MTEQINAAVKTMYGIWLQNNLDNYRFISEKAKILKNKLRELTINTQYDEEVLKGYYVEFCNMIAKNPFVVYLGLENENKYDIVTYDIEFFLVRNQYGIYVPIKFLKENNLPVSCSFKDEKKQAEIKVSEIKNNHGKIIKEMESKVNDLLKIKNTAKSYKVFLVLFFAGMCIYFYNVRFNLLKGIDWKNTTQLFALVLIILVLFVLFKSILEYRSSLSLKNVRKNWHKCQSMHDYFDSLQLKIEECDRQFLNKIADNEQTQTDTAIAFTKGSPAHDIDELYKGLKELAAKPKKIKRQIGAWSIIFIILVCGFFYLLQFDTFANNINFASIKKVVGQIFAVDKLKSDVQTGKSAMGQTTRQARVVGPEAKMMSDINGSSVVAVYKTGDSLVYYEDSKNLRNSNGLNWYKLTDLNGNSGWVVQTSIKFIDENEIAIESVSSNSTLRSTKGFVYKPEYACDGYYATCWQEGSKGNGTGKYILFKFKEEAKISKIVIINGNAKTKDVYLENNRLKTARLVFSDGKETSISLDDSYSISGQTINLPSPVLTKEVYFYIKEVYQGSDYNDTCISEISLYK